MLSKRSVVLFCMLVITVVGCKKEDQSAPQEYQGGMQTLQNTAQIEEQYKSVLAGDPKNYDALIGLGNLFYDTGQPDKAIESYTKALEVNPADPNVRTDMATMYRSLGKFDEAVAEFRKAAETAPSHVQSRYNLGITLYYDKKDPVGAAAAWEELLKIAPNHPEAAQLSQMVEQIRNPQKQAAKTPESGWVNK